MIDYLCFNLFSLFILIYTVCRIYCSVTLTWQETWPIHKAHLHCSLRKEIVALLVSLMQHTISLFLSGWLMKSWVELHWKILWLLIEHVLYNHYILWLNTHTPLLYSELIVDIFISVCPAIFFRKLVIVSNKPCISG